MCCLRYDLKRISIRPIETSTCSHCSYLPLIPQNLAREGSFLSSSAVAQKIIMPSNHTLMLSRKRLSSILRKLWHKSIGRKPESGRIRLQDLLRIRFREWIPLMQRFQSLLFVEKTNSTYKLSLLSVYVLPKITVNFEFYGMVYPFHA